MSLFLSLCAFFSKGVSALIAFNYDDISYAHIYIHTHLKTTTGILQDYLDVNMFRDRVANSQFQLSFVGTILEVCVNLMGPLSQIIASRFGSKAVLIIGTILATLGLELASLSTEIWHLYLTQGVMFGSGASFLYVVCVI